MEAALKFLTRLSSARQFSALRVPRLASKIVRNTSINPRLLRLEFNDCALTQPGTGCQAAMLKLLSLLVFLGAQFSIVLGSSDYHEQLVLTPLPTSLLLASFNFQSTTSFSAFEKQNFQYFPRSLGQILQHANTRELHLRFSLGRWDAETWGARPWGGAKEGGTGVEMWAWVEAETDEE